MIVAREVASGVFLAPRLDSTREARAFRLLGQDGGLGGHVREPGAIKVAENGGPSRLWRIDIAGDWSRTLLVVVIVAAVLAASGGFGTGGIPIVGRFAYWLALALIGFFLGRLGGRRLIPRSWFETRPVTTAALMTLMIGLPMTLVAALGSDWIGARAFRIGHLWEVLPSVLAVTSGMVLLAFMVQTHAPVETHDAPEGAPPARFLARLPPRLAGADLWAVQADDHYLRLHTSRGEDLILMRLADALAELEGVEGARTHRSWWVARHAIESVEQAEGRATLTLSGGLEAPVSRAYFKSLRQAGWF
jgi:hypothetical protein